VTDRRSGDELNAELLGRYLAGECSEPEAAMVRRHLMTDPKAARALEVYLQRLDGEHGRPQPPDAATSWVALRGRFENAQSGQRGRWRGGIATVAAAVAVGVLSVFAYEALRAPVRTAARTYVTAERQRAEIRLTDGTRVRVAPGSRLRVAAEFGVDRRDVDLEGEAFFEVAHDARRPFTGFAGNASARDLGTSFSVRSYSRDSAVQVFVRDGAVALSGVGRLGAGDVGRLGIDGRGSVRRRIDAARMLGWLDGRLVFRDAPLGRVLDDVRRWYGVEVRLTSAALATLPFTGELTDSSPSAAVDLVAVTLGLRVRRVGERMMLDAIPGRTPRASRRHAPRP
jgi:transmembrane sensor